MISGNMGKVRRAKRLGQSAKKHQHQQDKQKRVLDHRKNRHSTVWNATEKSGKIKSKEWPQISPACMSWKGWSYNLLYKMGHFWE